MFEILTEKIKARDYLCLCGNVSILLQILFSYLLFYLYVCCRLSCKIVENLKLWQIEVCHFSWLYLAFLGSTSWLPLFALLVCLVFLSYVFWIWNCDKLRLVREGRRTGMPFPCQWNVTEERHNSSLILYMSPGCFYLYLLKGERRLQDTGVIKVSSHFRGPLVLDIIVHICTNKCCLIDLDTIMHMCLDVSKHFSSTTLEKRIK